MRCASCIGLALAASGASVSEGGNLPTIEYLGQGYNLLLGNPRGWTGTLDSGFQQSVLELTFDSGLTVGTWTVPDDTDAVEVHNCATSFASQQIRGSESYSSSLKTSVSADFEGWGAAFSASAAYQHVEEGTSSDNSVYMQASATCSVYSVQVNTFAPPRVTQNFLLGVQHLPTTYDAANAADFNLFVSTFGTHVMHGAEFGGQWGQVSKFSQSSWANMISSGLDVSASASYSGVVSAGGSLSSETARSDAESFTSAATEQNHFNKGGTYSQDSTTWMTSVRAAPMPIYYQLWSLSDVLQPKFMPSSINATELAGKRQGLAQALTAYCSTMVAAGYISSCDPPAPDPAVVPANREWLPFLYSHRPNGIYYTQECPARAYIVEMVWSEQDGYGLVDLKATCSNTPTTSLRWTNNNHGDDNSALVCPYGFGGIQAKEQWGYGIINVRATCLGQTTQQESNTNSNGGWKDSQACPDDAQVLVGFEILEEDGFGIVNYRPKCSNGNLPSRRLRGQSVV